MLRSASLAFAGAGANTFLEGAQVPSKSARQKSPALVSSAVSPPLSGVITQEDDAFLEELERATFQFFWDQSDPQSGLTKDRCNVRAADNGLVASIAATGFGLTALCIGEKRGYIPYPAARNRVLATLRFLWKVMPHHRGFFYHFANIRTGERIWDSEISSIDTAMLLCGVLSCRQHFRHEEIYNLANEIFNRVEWTWLSEDTSLLPHGWSPEAGFLPYRWDYYSELMMMYLLGLGSSTHPLPLEAWTGWKRTTFEYQGMRYIGSFAPLFVHQYSHAWFDLRGKRDRFADYFQNSMTATEVHRRFCLELASQFPDYSDDLWGITASDSENGYVVWGGPPQMGPVDGTVVPSAPAGSMVFMPQATLRVLKHMKKQFGDRCWCRYGFVNAFNPLKNWYDTDVVGIDTGITLMMAENLRSGFVWSTFMKNREARKGLERAGFQAI
ncbi:MAG: hypothetical protein QOJ99_59 [Bryobacterales bacterium]|nr:hypothetical protein [Bryobacterales bacterium]